MTALNPQDYSFDLYDVSVDVEARDNGAWIEGARDMPTGLRLKVLGFDAPEINAMRLALQKERPGNYETDEDVRYERNLYENRRMTRRALLGWGARGPKDVIANEIPIGGELHPYSDELKTRLLNDPRFVRFVSAVMNAMAKADLQNLKYEKLAEKNLEAGSAPDSPPETAAETAA